MFLFKYFLLFPIEKNLLAKSDLLKHLNYLLNIMSSQILSQVPKRGIVLSAGFNAGVKESFFLIISYESLHALTFLAVGMDAPDLHA